ILRHSTAAIRPAMTATRNSGHNSAKQSTRTLYMTCCAQIRRVRVCRTLIAAMSVLFGSAPVRADVIELKSGQKIEGEVLKDAGGELIVDVGVAILKVPLSQIKSRQGAEQPAKEGSDAKSEKHEIYSTSELPLRTIKELTLKFGEGVVLVQ